MSFRLIAGICFSIRIRLPVCTQYSHKKDWTSIRDYCHLDSARQLSGNVFAAHIFSIKLLFSASFGTFSSLNFSLGLRNHTKRFGTPVICKSDLLFRFFSDAGCLSGVFEFAVATLPTTVDPVSPMHRAIKPNKT